MGAVGVLLFALAYCATPSLAEDGIGELDGGLLVELKTLNRELRSAETKKSKGGPKKSKGRRRKKNKNKNPGRKRKNKANKNKKKNGKAKQRRTKRTKTKTLNEKTQRKATRKG